MITQLQVLLVAKVLTVSVTACVAVADLADGCAAAPVNDACLYSAAAPADVACPHPTENFVP